MLNYRIDGRGSHLLMVHGFGISFSIWDALLPILRQYFTLILVELPGIGFSPIPPLEKSYLDSAVSEIEKVRNHLGIEQWNIISYSSGTRVAEKYIQVHFKHVEHVVFLCAAQTSSLKAFVLQLAIQIDRYIPKFGDWILSGNRLKFLIDLLGFNFKKNKLSSKWFTEISSQNTEVLKATLSSLADNVINRILVPDKIPTLFIWGEEDLVVDMPSVQSQRDCKINANHSAPQTSAQRIAEVILPFLLV